MLNFTADPRDGYKYSAGCNTCCCEAIHMKPGETNLLRIHYAGWVIPLMGRGLTVNTWFEITKISPDISAAGNDAPNVSLLAGYTTPLNTALTADLNAYVSDADGGPLVFRHLAIYGPHHGSLTMPANGNGQFTYTPQTGWNGYDDFYYTVSDGFNTVTGYARIGTGSLPANAPPIPPRVDVIRRRKVIDTDYHNMSVPIIVDPTAVTGDIYRLNVRQEAVDCDGNTFYHISCFDIIIGKC